MCTEHCLGDTGIIGTIARPPPRSARREDRLVGKNENVVDIKSNNAENTTNPNQKW